MGLIAVRDIIRSEAKKALAQLKETGVKRVIVLTGDQEETARTIAFELGIDEIHWKLLPEDKAVILEQFQAEGCKVAFVGDGHQRRSGPCQGGCGYIHAQGRGYTQGIRPGGLMILCPLFSPVKCP